MNDIITDFCRMTIALPLTRNGYTSKVNSTINGHTIDLDVEKFTSAGSDRFFVLVDSVEGRLSIDPDLRIQAKALSEEFLMPVYLAVVNYTGNEVAVDPELEKRMKYSKNDLKVSIIRKQPRQYEPVGNDYN